VVKISTIHTKIGTVLTKIGTVYLKFGEKMGIGQVYIFQPVKFLNMSRMSFSWPLWQSRIYYETLDARRRRFCRWVWEANVCPG
jgi:hypothetical protein